LGLLSLKKERLLVAVAVVVEAEVVDFVFADDKNYYLIR
jgi:hypothetical protein